MRAIQDDLSHLADKLRKCYQVERNQLNRALLRDPGYRVPKDRRASGPEGKRDSVWKKLARFCQKRKIDPLRYVQWCLSVNQVLLGRPPEPNQLLAPSKMDEFVKSWPKQVQRDQERLKREMDIASCSHSAYKTAGVKPEDAWAVVLLDTGLEISPLVRFWLARTIGGERFDKIADRFEVNALLQYHRNPIAYDACRPLRRRLPEDFADKAEWLYDRLLDKEP